MCPTRPETELLLTSLERGVLWEADRLSIIRIGNNQVSGVSQIVVKVYSKLRYPSNFFVKYHGTVVSQNKQMDMILNLKI